MHIVDVRLRLAIDPAEIHPWETPRDTAERIVLDKTGLLTSKDIMDIHELRPLHWAD